MILSSIDTHPKNRVAIKTPSEQVTYGELFEKVELVYQWIKANQVKVLLLESENVPEWIYIDLACQKANIVFVPVPDFFTRSQLDSIISRVKPDVVIQPSIQQKKQNDFVFTGFSITKIDCKASEKPEGTSKITFTSGSTGEPKGVCLSINNQYLVACSLFEKIAVEQPVHFSLLSFSTLLENIAGIYAPLMAGGSVFITSDEERGFNGAIVTSPNHLLKSISNAQPNTIILVPELLQLLIIGIGNGWDVPESLKFIAVGGSRVSPSLLTYAHALKLPVYQGYGLSECASVVSLCLPEDPEDDHSGKVLPHLKVQIRNGEIIVSGNSFLGYLDDPESWYQTEVKTGDIGCIKNGFIEISGRCSNLLINSFGRNISPEWVESELLATGKFKQVVVFGDAKPYCIALILPSEINQSKHGINNTVEVVNSHLPEFAQIKKILVLDKPLTKDLGLITTNGRPRRQHIYQHFSKQIESLYSVNR